MLRLPFFPALILSSALCLAQPAASNLAGNWVFQIEQQGDRIITARVQLNVSGEKVTAKAPNFSINGTAKDSSINLEWLERDGKVGATLTGKHLNGRLAGSATAPDGLHYTWTADRETTPPAQPRTHQFSPTEFQRYFSGALAPVLRISPGDTVQTWSVDAGGADAAGKRRSLGGNPLTGPFYVEGALPGDTLIVRLNRIRTNRDWAQSGTGILSNAVSPSYTANLKPAKDFSGRWRLDPQSNTASLDKPTDALKSFRVPIQPMLGCVAVAPPRLEVISTRDSGSFGGNMDYNSIREGVTVYLPVYHPGALLLLGDGHAAQGDGELTGDALETSMDFEFQVDLIRGQPANMPYAEDADHWMIIGIAGSLDEALRRATTGMARYLETQHGLNSNEAAIVLGFAVKYDIADLVGTQVSIVAKLPKSTLAQLPPRKRQE